MKRTFVPLASLSSKAISQHSSDGVPTHYHMTQDAIFQPFVRNGGRDVFGHKHAKCKKMRRALLAYSRQQLGEPLRK